MIQPPLLGVVNAASAVSARTVTCRGPRCPELFDAIGVHGGAGAPIPEIAAG